ncbi:MAG: hypothetical protein EOM70_08970, partial [Clostridia bacterium]|nr:hypothetical protein [Clostridia bacterium]
MVKKDGTGSDKQVGSEQEVKNAEHKKGQKPHADASVEQHAPIHPGEMTAAHAQDQTSGPTITMQGVSGKKITGVVKVVKATKHEAAADQPGTEESAATRPVPEAAVEGKPVTATVKPVESAPAPAPTGATHVEKAVPVASGTAGTPVTAAKPAPATTPSGERPPQTRTPSTPAGQASSQATGPVQRGAGSGPSPYGTPNRPQSGNYNRDRAPGQGGPSQSPYGTPNRPQSGNYNRDRAPGPGGPGSTPYGTPNRPQSGNYNRDRAPGPGGPGSTPYG